MPSRSHLNQVLTCQNPRKHFCIHYISFTNISSTEITFLSTSVLSSVHGAVSPPPGSKPSSAVGTVHACLTEAGPTSSPAEQSALNKASITTFPFMLPIFTLSTQYKMHLSNLADVPIYRGANPTRWQNLQFSKFDRKILKLAGRFLENVSNA